MQLFNTLISAFLLTAAAIAQSDVKVHVVQVGLNGSLAFSPENITANPGEIVQFQFMAKVTSLSHKHTLKRYANKCDNRRTTPSSNQPSLLPAHPSTLSCQTSLVSSPASCPSQTVSPSSRLWSTTPSLFGLIAARRVIAGRVWFLLLMRMSLLVTPFTGNKYGDVNDGQSYKRKQNL